MVSRVRISRSVLEGIRQESAVRAPMEACGLLFGEGGAVTGFQVADNVAEDARRQFEIDPAALFAALRGERAGGPKLNGYWHSHPSGDAQPSAMDAAMAEADGKLWLIAGREVLAWRAVADGAMHGRFDPVALIVTD